MTLRLHVVTIIGVHAIGIRELKAKLSACLQLVKAGEVVLVTDRGHVVAELRRPTVKLVPPERPGALDRLTEVGALRPGLARDSSVYSAVRARAPEGTAATLIEQLRQ